MSEHDPMWPHRPPQRPASPVTEESMTGSESSQEPSSIREPAGEGQKRQAEQTPHPAQEQQPDMGEFQAEIPPYMEGPRMRMGQAPQAQSERRLAHPVDGGILSTILGNDPATRRLMGGALSLVLFLLLIVGTWTFLRSRPKDIPIIAPPSFPVKQRPVDPGGMQIMSDDLANDPDISGKGAVHLTPPSEEPDARMLSRDTASDNTAHPTNMTQAASSASPTAPTTSPGAVAPSGAVPHPNMTGGVKSDMSPSTPQGGDDDASDTQKQSPKDAAPPSEGNNKASPSEKSAPASKPASSVKKSDKKAKSSKTKEAAKAENTSHGHGQVQLAALENEAQAKKEWAHLENQAPEILAHHSPLYMKIERNGHHFVRLRVGGFPDNTAAKHFCAKLHAHSIACTIAAF